MCFRWLVLTVSAAARETDGLASLQYVFQSDPFFGDEKGVIENGCIPYARKKSSHLHFFFIMLRYVRG